MTIDTRILADAAFAAMDSAYAPYSGYRVGAALQCDDGAIYTAGNIENASYGLSLCAERAAVAKAVSDGKRSFAAIFIAADGDEAPWPCGACRQVLYEFAAPDMVIFTQHAGGKIHMREMAVLLPKAFTLKIEEFDEDDDFGDEADFDEGDSEPEDEA